MSPTWAPQSSQSVSRSNRPRLSSLLKPDLNFVLGPSTFLSVAPSLVQDDGDSPDLGVMPTRQTHYDYEPFHRCTYLAELGELLDATNSAYPWCDYEVCEVTELLKDLNKKYAHLPACCQASNAHDIQTLEYELGERLCAIGHPINDTLYDSQEPSAFESLQHQL